METFDGSFKKAQASVIPKGFSVLDQLSNAAKVHMVPSIGLDNEFGGFPKDDLGPEIPDEECNRLAVEAIGRIPNQASPRKGRGPDEAGNG